jgi:hypothetical protein
MDTAAKAWAAVVLVAVASGSLTLRVAGDAAAAARWDGGPGD